MGSWGPGIFSDDVAADIRDDYRELLAEGVADDVATARIIETYSDLDPDEEHVLWLALAAAQVHAGRLDGKVKSRALDIIDSGRDLDAWVEASPRDRRKREATLAALRDQLTGPQVPPRRHRRQWRDDPGLVRGDVLVSPDVESARRTFVVTAVDEGGSVSLEEVMGASVTPRVAGGAIELQGFTDDDGDHYLGGVYLHRRSRTAAGWESLGFAVTGRVDPPGSRLPQLGLEWVEFAQRLRRAPKA